MTLGDHGISLTFLVKVCNFSISSFFVTAIPIFPRMLQNLSLAFLHFLKILFLQDIHCPPPLQTTGLTSFQEKGWWIVRSGTESCHMNNRSCFSFLSPPSAFLRPWSRGTTHLSPCKGRQLHLDCYSCRFVNAVTRCERNFN